MAKAYVEMEDDKNALKYFKKAYKIRPTEPIKVVIYGLKNKVLEIEV